MAAETPESADGAWSAAIAAAILRRGALLHTASLLLTVATIVAGVATRPGSAWLVAIAVVAVLCVVEFWLAARVALDAELFDVLAARPSDLAQFDRAMQSLGLMPAPKANRPLADRIRGAFRLLKLQALTLGLQVAVLVVGGLRG
jgi:hypothetical protein